ncbi:MAG TPA: hypothetical protein VGK23_11550 [Methanomassiliicoccales archaeon]|jgi:hypothetical protein
MLYDAARKIDTDCCIHNAIRVAESKESELADIILDPYSLKVVAMTIGRSLSVKEITDHLGVSIVTSYSIVQRLTEIGLLVPTEKLRTSTHGRPIGYTSTVKSGSIELRDGCLEIRCNSKEGRECFAKNIIDEYRPENMEKHTKGCTIWIASNPNVMV